MTKRRSRGFALTCNNWTWNHVAIFMANALETDYSVCGFEVGTHSGTPHLQCYIHYPNARFETSIRELYPGFHVGVSIDKPINNCGYCTKDGDYWEHGELPQQGKVKYRTISYVMKNPKSHVQLYNQYRKSYAEINSKVVQQKKRELFAIPIESVSQYITKYNPTDCLLFEDSTLYNGEKAVFINYDVECLYGKKNIPIDPWLLWLQGYPSKIKKGYIEMYYDPDKVYFVYNNLKSHSCLLEIYKDLIIFPEEPIELIESESEYWDNI